MDKHDSGRVIRLKQGYNPNSSSVGTDVPTFLYISLGASAVTGIVLNLLASARDRIRRDSRSEQAPDTGQKGSTG